jgi:hypothetical protein
MDANLMGTAGGNDHLHQGGGRLAFEYRYLTMGRFTTGGGPINIPQVGIGPFTDGGGHSELVRVITRRDQSPIDFSRT